MNLVPTLPDIAKTCHVMPRLAVRARTAVYVEPPLGRLFNLLIFLHFFPQNNNAR